MSLLPSLDLMDTRPEGMPSRMTWDTWGCLNEEAAVTSCIPSRRFVFPMAFLPMKMVSSPISSRKNLS